MEYLPYVVLLRCPALLRTLARRIIAMFLIYVN